MVEVEVLLGAGILTLVILLILFALGFKIVREDERLVIFMMGRVLPARGPGLVLLPPFFVRTVRVSLPVQLVPLREESPYATGGPTRIMDETIRGHPGVTVGEVAVRAAMLVAQHNPKARRATPEDFLKALEAMEKGRNGWGS